MVYACIDNRKQRSLSIWPLLMRVTNECETGLLWCYIVAWTECNNRHKYYHNNLHNSEFMDISGRLTGMKTTFVNLDHFTDLLEIKHIYI